MPGRTEIAGAVGLRTSELEAVFAGIARTRMAGVPVLNPALRVEAVGFALAPPRPGEPDGARGAIGVLITPWFMNLVSLPLRRQDAADAVGAKRALALGDQVFEFIGAHEGALGSFAACSLFSPMFEFADQDSARATAQAVLDLLRPPPASPAQSGPAGSAPPGGTPRRAFLFGRGAPPVVGS